uniref:Uncharacterized protein n=1 Tax=Cacopsylla melanoneura TaxID=428564 RepID=A0A8D8RFI4_9HEMI
MRTKKILVEVVMMEVKEKMILRMEVVMVEVKAKTWRMEVVILVIKNINKDQGPCSYKLQNAKLCAFTALTQGSFGYNSCVKSLRLYTIEGTVCLKKKKRPKGPISCLIPPITSHVSEILSVVSPCSQQSTT